MPCGQTAFIRSSGKVTALQPISNPFWMIRSRPMNRKDSAVFWQKKMASEWVAAPGTSEHQLGIAVDINADKTKSTNDEVYTWLAEHAWEYGFILRYPKDKENVTGTGYEPWHYRYVGKEAAKEIWQEGCCLEEYVTQN